MYESLSRGRTGPAAIAWADSHDGQSPSRRDGGMGGKAARTAGFRREGTLAMLDHFDLVVTADYPSRTAEFRLLDGHGSQVAYKHTDFNTISVSRQQGLFDLRNYLRQYVEDGKEAASVAEIGVCIAEEVLGAEIFLKLWESQARRTLRIQLPGASEEENLLAAALARVPWEIGRPSADQPTLGERNLLVRVVHDMAEPKSTPIELGPNESLRVLFVFAEARGSHPLAARRERQELLELFEQEIYPKRRVVAHFLSHGVTRERLEAQIRENGGYHVVHWSGHGHLNLLELARAGGGSDRLSGKELLDLCGGLIPRLVFLSACHSGDILRVKNWNDFLAVAQGQSPGTKQGPPAETKDIPLDRPPGYTGTAHAMLQGGVPSVVAMRYAVGDEYARDLAVAFYRALLAYAQPQNAAAALTTARQSLLDPKKHAGGRYDVCDHATPVLYGAEQPGLTLPKGRSPGLETRDPRRHQIAELTTAGHEHFVGRTWELAGLGAGVHRLPGRGRGEARGGHHRPRRHGQDGADRRGAGALGVAVRVGAALSGQAEPAGFRGHAARHPHQAPRRAGPLPRPCEGPARRCDPPSGGRGVHRVGSAGTPDAQPRPRLAGRGDPAGAGQLRDQPQAPRRAERRCGRAGVGLPGPGLGPLPGPAGGRAGRLAVTGADHLPSAARGAGGGCRVSRAARPAAAGRGRALPARARRACPG